MARTQVRRSEVEDQTLSTQDWIDVARRMLIRDGVGALKIDRLARECNVTRGGFYWRFGSRQELLRALLEEWRTANTEPMLQTLRGPGSPNERLQRTFNLWIQEEKYDPAFDTAVRAWAASSKKVAAVVAQVDEVRIQAFQAVFEDLGYVGLDALARARVTYFHQVGYYALGINESKKRRRDLFPHYYHLLVGRSPSGVAPLIKPAAKRQPKG